MTRIPIRAMVAASTARLVGVVVAFVGSALVFVEPAATSRWIGFVQDTGMYLTVLSFAIAGSLFSVAGYLTGSRRLTRATELARGVRSVAWAFAAVCVGDLVWLVGGLAVVHVAAFARTFAAGVAPSAMAWSLEVLSFASASMCYLMGVLAGVVVRHPVGAVVAATAPYGATLLANQVLSVRPALQPFARQVAPYIDQSWGPSAVPAHGPILLLALYCLLVAATAGQLAVGALRMRFGGFAVLSRPSPRALVAPVGALLVAVLIAATVTADDFYTARTDGWACSADQRICAWDRGNGVDVGTWDAALTQVIATLDGAPIPDLQFAEFGVPQSSSEQRITLWPPTGTLTVDRITALILPEYVTRITATSCAADDVANASAALLDALSRSLAQNQQPEQGLVKKQLDACR